MVSGRVTPTCADNMISTSELQNTMNKVSKTADRNVLFWVFFKVHVISFYDRGKVSRGLKPTRIYETRSLCLPPHIISSHPFLIIQLYLLLTYYIEIYEDTSTIHLFKIPFLRGWWQRDGKIAWVQCYLKETPFSFHEPKPNPAVIRNGFIAQIS